MRRAFVAALVACVACVASLAVAVASARQESASTTARLNSAAAQLDALTDGSPSDNQERAAIAWGYSERLRLGLESPFRLIESAARDSRLGKDERRTVSWALLAHVLRGESHHVDAAALDLLGPFENGRSVTGEQHLALIADAMGRALNPRAAELAVRLAYTLASAERLVDGAAPLLAAEAAALTADREIARRDARHVVRTARDADPIDVVRRRRASRSFYAERPVLLSPSDDVEAAAIALAAPLLEQLRAMRPLSEVAASPDPVSDAGASSFAPRLAAVGLQTPPSAPLAVTVQRYLPMIRAQAPRVDAVALGRVRNAEMLVAVTHVPHGTRAHRRAVGRLMLAAGASMRSLAQEPVWFAGDSVPGANELAAALGLTGISFDRDVPAKWRPYYLRSIEHAMRDLRLVLPTLRLHGVRVRFRMDAPADSALAMHDPRTRTLHLPIPTAGGTLVHEVAHDLDRQSAQQLALAGYRSDHVARGWSKQLARTSEGAGRVAASLRALTAELSEPPGATRAADRPAEVFATRVDWFVASALAREGISSGFLSAVQDEMLTGHVVHPERLRASGSSKSLVTALEGITTVAAFAAEDRAPSAQSLVRWSLAEPVDRQVAGDIVRGERRSWRMTPTRLIGERSCDQDASGRVALIRMAAESRARGWLRLRARWTSEVNRPAWARGTLRQGPWDTAVAEQRVAELRDYILLQLATNVDLPAGLNAYAAPLAHEARCAD
ncbi:MAG: hypothetical protein WD825_06905 [Gemmatimonadaceae bacterium]